FVFAGLVAAFQPLTHDYVTGCAGTDAAAGVIERDIRGPGDVEDAARQPRAVVRHAGRIDLEHLARGQELDLVFLLRWLRIRGSDVRIDACHDLKPSRRKLTSTSVL